MKIKFIFCLIFLHLLKIKCGQEIWHLKKNVSSEVNIINLCEGCRLYVHAAIIKLFGKKSEDDVYNILSKFNICLPEFVQTTNEVNNKRKIIEGCLAFADVYDGYLEELFIRRKNDDNYYEKLCLDHTGVCHIEAESQIALEEVYLANFGLDPMK